MWFNSISPYFGRFLFFLILSYFVGKTIRFLLRNYLEKQSFFTDTFYNLFLGKLMICLLTALFFTFGKTVFLQFIPLGFVVLDYYWNRTQSSTHKVQTHRTKFFFIPVLFLLGLVVFAWEVFISTYSEGFPFKMPFADMLWYADISQYLTITGEENIHHATNLLDKNFNGLVLYHYFDLWLNGFVTATMGGTSYLNLAFVTTPALIFTVLIGILSLVQHYRTINAFYILLAFLFLFLSGIILNLGLEWDFLRHLEGYNADLFHYKMRKYAPYYLVFMAFSVLTVQKEYFTAIICLLCLPVMSILTLPAVIGAVLLLSPVFYFFEYFRRKYLYRILILGITTPAFLLVFSQIFGYKSELYGSVNFFLLDFSETQFNILFGSVLLVCILYLPFLLLLFFFQSSFKKIFQEKIVFLLAFWAITSFFGLLAWALTYQKGDSWQLFVKPAMPFLNCVFIVLFLSLMAHQRRSAPKAIIKIVLVIVLVFNMLRLFQLGRNQIAYSPVASEEWFSPDFLFKVREVLNSRHFNAVGVSIVGAADRPWASGSYKNTPMMFRTGDYLALMKPRFTTLPISDFDVYEVVTGEYRQGFSDSPFYRFVQKQKEEKKFVSTDQSQMDFIDLHFIEYVAVAKNGRISELLAKRIEQEITDERSGEKFLVLKKKGME